MSILETFLWESSAAARAMLRNPAFLLLTALTLSLGIAVCTATFALVDDFVLTPPRFADPAKLAIAGPASPSNLTYMSPQQYLACAGLPEFSASGAASFLRSSTVQLEGEPFLVSLRPVTASFLDTLGIRLPLGRNFTGEEDRDPGANVAIVSHRFWVRQLARVQDPARLAFRIEGKVTRIVGVLPPEFHFIENLDMLIPLALPAVSADTGNHLLVVARLAPGVAMSRASQAVNERMHSRATELNLKSEERQVFVAAPLWRALAGPGRSVTSMFFAFGVCLLGLVAANVSNLLALRAVTRNRTMTLRSALGASAARLALPAIAEGTLIGLLGSVVGIALAQAGLKLVNTHLPTDWMNAGNGAWLGARALALALALGAAVPCSAVYWLCAECRRAGMLRGILPAVNEPAPAAGRGV